MPGARKAMAADVRLEKDRLLAELGTVLEAAKDAQDLSVADVARRAGLSKQGAIYVRKCQSDPKLTTLVALCRAVGLRLVITSEPYIQENRR